MTNKNLLMWIEAPLQSWGVDSKFGRRDTLDFPTKSGILGLLCCALGAGGEQVEFLKTMASMKQSVLSFVPIVAKNSKVQKPGLRLPLLRDFHMVGSGYDEKDKWQRMHIPKTKEGKSAVGGGAKLTYRYYLQDAFFAVVLETPLIVSEELANALKNPVWDLYLGRKHCVPTDFIFRGVFNTQLEAIEYAKNIAVEKQLVEDFRILDGEHEGETFILNDIPINFGQHKKYRDRVVTKVLL